VKILGIETATYVLGLAIINEERVIASYEKSGLTHSKDLIPSVEDLLSEAQFSIHELDGIAVSLGPGSFTGLRIGLSASKGLAQALGIPMVGVPTLDVIAMNVKDEEFLVCPLIEAGRDLVYFALYYKKRKLTSYMVLAVNELYKFIKRPTILVGPGLRLFAEPIKKTLSSLVRFTDESLWAPRAFWVAKLGLSKIKRQRIPPLSEVLPLYIKRPWVEERR
jgi:tRNA threonylcarbamoyladenosine biosynthesis protein TsaB